MPLAPSTAVRGAAPALQPYYYNSSLFVNPFREDIAELLAAFVDAATSGTVDASPFKTFKQCWTNSGFRYVHLQCIEHRARESFLATVERLLLERISPIEPSLSCVGALFALYVFHFTQPSSLWKRDFVSIPIDTYKELLNVPSRLTGVLSENTSDIISQLQPAFCLSAPREYLSPLPTSTLQPMKKTNARKVGRPSAATRKQNYAASVRSLHQDIAVFNQAGPLAMPLPDDYITAKDHLKSLIREEEEDMVKQSAEDTAKRMKDVEDWARTQEHDIEGWDWNGPQKIGLELINRQEPP